MVFTDNSALTHLQKNRKPSPRQVRWLEKMQSFTLKIQHVTGRLNVAADALSRNPVKELVLQCMVAEYVEKSGCNLVGLCFDKPIWVPMRVGTDGSEYSWWHDYCTDTLIRRKYFTSGREPVVQC